MNWTCASPAPLLACGVDAERIERFDHLAGEERPWPLVFSARECAQARTRTRPAESFCAAFCCKEALVKAIEQPFHLPGCEFLGDPQASDGVLELSEEIVRPFGIGAARVRLMRPTPEEIAAVVYLLSERSRG